MLSSSSTGGSHGLSEHTSDTALGASANAELSLLFANYSPLFLLGPFVNCKKRGAERTVHALGTDGANLSIRLSAPSPQSSRSSVPVCFSCSREQSHCCVVTVTQTPHTKTLFHFLFPFGSALRPQLSLTPSVVPFLFKVSSADFVKDKSKSEPEGHPLLFIIAQTQRPAACHKQP